MRSRNDPSFAQWLLDVGDGRHRISATPANTSSRPASDVVIPERYICNGDIIDEIYPHIRVRQLSNDELLRHIILCPTNQSTFAYNERILQRIPSRYEQVYYSTDRISDTYNGRRQAIDTSDFAPETLHSLTPNGLPLHELHLKPNVVVMLLRNLNVKKGLCNGTRLLTLRLNKRSVLCKVLTGTHIGSMVLIHRIKLESDDSSYPFKFVREQLPIRVAFAMTINKSQGQSFDRVGVVLDSPVFSHGQLYVALSRCTNPDGLRVSFPNMPPDLLNRQSAGISTPNIVFHETLST